MSPANSVTASAASSPENEEVVGNISDHDLRMDGVLRETMNHLTFNILAELDDDALHSSQLSTLAEHERQSEQRLRLIEEIMGIMEILVSVSDPEYLLITWPYDRRDWPLLRDAIEEGIICRSYVNNFMMATWEKILASRLQGKELDYQLPPIRIRVPLVTFPEDTQLGHHHLGILYPFNRNRVMEEVWATSANNQRIPTIPTRRRRRPIQRPDRIYPLIKSKENETDDSWKVFPTVIFPDLRMIILRLTTNLVETYHPQLRHIPYRRIIHTFGGPQGITNRLLQYVDSSIVNLCGKKIKVELLDEVQAQQLQRVDQWPPNSGYLDYVTDDNDGRYCRFYVGQSSLPKKRIREHIRCAASLIPQSLHYFVVWMGKGRRAMNFIKLWTLSHADSLDEEYRLTFANILEMSLSAAFQALPQHAIETYFGEMPWDTYSNVGLNILSPLYQGVSIKSHIRQAYTLQVGESRDPQIRMWPSFRNQTRERDEGVEKWDQGQQPVKWSEYANIFQSAISTTGISLGDDIFGIRTSLDTSISNRVSAQEQVSIAVMGLTGEHVRDEYPVGSATAKIGIILSSCTLRVEATERDDVYVPWGIRESGFDEAACLLWFADPRERSLTRKIQTADCHGEVTKALRDFNRHIIETGQLQVIILDGKEASEYVRPGLPPDSMQPFEITLYCGRISGFVEKKGNTLKRVYIETPCSLVCLWASPGPTIQRICEIFRFAGMLTTTYGIRPFFCSSSSAVYHILKSYHEENNGAEKMTAATISPILQAFLFRKGFKTAEDIQRIEDIGGSLSRGLLLLLHTLRRNTKIFGKTRPLKYSTAETHKRGVFNEDELREMERLFANSDAQPEPAGEQQDEPPDYKLIDVAYESFGRVDEQEFSEISRLVYEKEEEMKRGWVPSDGDLDTEINDIDVDDARGEIFPDYQGEDYQVSIQPKIRQTPIALGGRHRQRETQRDTTILTDGTKYCGHWDNASRHLEMRITPEIAAIALTAAGTTRGDFPPEVLVKGHIHDSKRHPLNWALDSKATDPGAKLAFSIDTSSGPRYLFANDEGNARKANTFVDWMSGCPIETIGMRPRRHIMPM